MAATSDFAKEYLKKAEARLKELKPLVEEHNLLAEEVAQLKGESAPAPAAPAAGGGRTRRKRTTARKSSSNGSGKRGRPPEKARKVAEFVAKNPGVTVAEIAKGIGEKPPYLYKVTAGLVEEGALKKQGKKYHPAGKSN